MVQSYFEFLRFNQGPDVNLNIMLNLLKVFPEELQNRHLRLGENRRTAVEKELAAESDAVFNCLVCDCNPKTDF